MVETHDSKRRYAKGVLVRFDDELKMQLEKRANDEGLNLSAYIRTVLIRELKKGGN